MMGGRSGSNPVDRAPTKQGHGQRVKRAHSVQAVVAHACHGHRYRPSLVSLSGTELIPTKQAAVMDVNCRQAD